MRPRNFRNRFDFGLFGVGFFSGPGLRPYARGRHNSENSENGWLSEFSEELGDLAPVLAPDGDPGPGKRANSESIEIEPFSELHLSPAQGHDPGPGKGQLRKFRKRFVFGFFGVAFSLAQGSGRDWTLFGVTGAANRAGKAGLPGQASRAGRAHRTSPGRLLQIGGGFVEESWVF